MVRTSKCTALGTNLMLCKMRNSNKFLIKKVYFGTVQMKLSTTYGFVNYDKKGCNPQTAAK